MPTKPIRGSQINLAHPLAKNLTNAWVMTEGQGDSIFDSILKNPVKNVGSFVNSPTWVGGPHGFGIDFVPGDSDHINFNGAFRIPPNVGADLTQITIAVDVTVDALTNITSRIITKQKGAATDDHDWMMSTEGGTAIRLRLRINSIVQQVIGDGATLVLGVRTMWFIHYDGTTFSLLKNGINMKSEAASGSVDQRTDTVFRVGAGESGGADEFFNGKVFGIYFWNRALGQHEMSRFSADPYQIFDFGMNPAIFGQLISAAVARRAVLQSYGQVIGQHRGLNF